MARYLTLALLFLLTLAGSACPLDHVEEQINAVPDARYRAWLDHRLEILHEECGELGVSSANLAQIEKLAERSAEPQVRLEITRLLMEVENAVATRGRDQFLVDRTKP
ncbi:MAG: hypothetical protein AB7S38_14955 [Vulcanimicrobiota bacterium]